LAIGTVKKFIPVRYELPALYRSPCHDLKKTESIIEIGFTEDRSGTESACSKSEETDLGRQNLPYPVLDLSRNLKTGTQIRDGFPGQPDEICGSGGTDRKVKKRIQKTGQDKPGFNTATGIKANVETFKIGEIWIQSLQKDMIVNLGEKGL
jgi:hypothetical protein